MITPIITPLEADAFLAAYADWLALTDAVKESHIYNSSLYIQTQYDCLSVNGVVVDWTDTATVPEEVKNACALYALADSVGNLFGDVGTADTRKTTREMVKAGSVTVDEEFSLNGTTQSGVAASFAKPDMLMSIYCAKSSGSIGSCGSSVIRN